MMRALNKQNGWFARAACAAVLLAGATGLAGGAWAQETPAANAATAANAQIPADTAPDVQVIVLPMPSGKWGVSAVYPKQISQDKAEGRLKALLQAGKWRPENVAFENGRMQRDSAKIALPPDMPAAEKAKFAVKVPPPSVMSSITFETMDNPVDFANGTMNLAPFARGFRDLNRVHVTYIVPPPFAFRGIRHFESRDLSLDMRSGGEGAYTYVMNIKNHQMGNITLPTTEPLSPARTNPEAQNGAAWKQRRLVGGGLVVCIALIAGGLVYLWANRLGKS